MRHYRKAFATASVQGGMTPSSYIRYLMLTNTRFVCGSAAVLSALNERISRADQQFRTVERFNIVTKPGIEKAATLDELVAVPDQNGMQALFEFAGALPRAKLYSNWQVETNDQMVLTQLVDPAFAPDQSVLVSGGIQPAAPISNTNQAVGSVDFASYSPKDIVLKSDAASPSVLLLNDHFDPDWKVFVDGDQKPLLRCNYIMRGVYLKPGEHTIEFRFEQYYGLLYAGLTAIGAGLVILVAFLVSNCLSHGKSAPEKSTA